VSDAVTSSTWVVLSTGIVAMLIAGWRRRRGSPSAGGRDGQRATLLFGLVVLLNAVPRLAGAPSGVTFALSTIALIPLAGFIALSTRIARTGQQQPGPDQH
jgi:hypothetical protein